MAAPCNDFIKIVAICARCAGQKQQHFRQWESNPPGLPTILDLREYRKNIEKDAALARRFQPVCVDGPTVEETISILRGLKRSTNLTRVTVQDGQLTINGRQFAQAA
jgi:hypothetical protein